MTLQNDQDPGWWRRGMSRRAQFIVVGIAAAVLVGVLLYVFVSGIPLF